MSVFEQDLLAQGIFYTKVPVKSYREYLDKIKSERGYITEDVVELSEQQSDYGTINDKFSREHSHSDDEVRYVLEGDGIFDIRSKDDLWIRLFVEPSDFITIPKGRNHCFQLRRGRIKAVRLFADAAGWHPTYRIFT